MLLDFERLGVGLIVKVHKYAEARLGPENPHTNSGVLFNTYEVDVLIEDRIKHLRIEVSHEPGVGMQRMDWATTQDSGSVHFLQDVS